MSEAFNEAVRKYRAEAAAAGKMRALSDSEVEKVAGGVGGADEATCPKCGKPMKKIVFGGCGKPMEKIAFGGGDPMWKCDKCGVNQLLPDAEFIEMVKYMEQIGYPGIEYPIWWNQVKK